MQDQKHITTATTVLRLGLAVVFLWFGFSQLFDGVSWVYWVPEWAVSLFHLPPAMIVLANGIFEVVAGALLAMNVWVRPIAFVLAVHFAIITVDIGPDAVGVRDFGLTLATLALALLNKKAP
ncbi:DoxX family protein [Candidatus Kaiserbacteria bacterium]|nr:DoxX family protein [Candidatus Kaiserbacteria bacterium]